MLHQGSMLSLCLSGCVDSPSCCPCVWSKDMGEVVDICLDQPWRFSAFWIILHDSAAHRCVVVNYELFILMSLLDALGSRLISSEDVSSSHWSGEEWRVQLFTLLSLRQVSHCIWGRYVTSEHHEVQPDTHMGSTEGDLTVHASTLCHLSLICICINAYLLVLSWTVMQKQNKQCLWSICQTKNSLILGEKLLSCNHKCLIVNGYSLPKYMHVHYAVTVYVLSC